MSESLAQTTFDTRNESGAGFENAIFGGRPHVDGIPEWRPWEASRLHWWPEDHLDLILSTTRDRKVRTPEELDAAIKEPMRVAPTRNVWIHERLEDEAQAEVGRHKIPNRTNTVYLASHMSPSQSTLSAISVSVTNFLKAERMCSSTMSVNASSPTAGALRSFTGPGVPPCGRRQTRPPQAVLGLKEAQA